MSGSCCLSENGLSSLRDLATLGFGSQQHLIQFTSLHCVCERLEGRNEVVHLTDLNGGFACLQLDAAVAIPYLSPVAFLYTSTAEGRVKARAVYELYTVISLSKVCDLGG